ncbi:MAG: hypothetical protein ACRCYX_01805 [Dermatophilaceae bacterium]
MTDLPTPEASRPKAQPWRDSRLIAGGLLILVSAALGVGALIDVYANRFVTTVAAGTPRLARRGRGRTW